jgi:hypothetical protein
MDMDQAAVWLAGTILTVLGFLTILAGVLVANNLVAKYWKPWGWKFFPAYLDQPQPRFLTPEEIKIAPHLDPLNKEGITESTTNKK